MDLSLGTTVKKPPVNAGDIRDTGLSPGLGRSPGGGGHGNPLQYYYLENPMNRGAWWATVHRVADMTSYLACMHAPAHSECCMLWRQRLGCAQLGLWLYICLCLPPPTNLIPQCDDIVSSLSPSLVTLGELKPSQQHNLTTFLRLAGCSVQGECPGSEDVVNNQKLFSTAYFLVSALAGMDQKKGKKCCCLKIALFTVWDIWYIRFPPF